MLQWGHVMTLDELRAEIDLIDAQIVELIKKRMQCVHGVGKLKKDANSHIFVPERESQLIEKVLLHNSAMLPGERIALAHDAQIMVQYGNAIKKGGKAIAAQRVLRRVQRDPDASSAHPQIEQ